MTTATHPIPSDLVDGLRTGDEPTIERGFRSLFPSLAEEAAAELGDASIAGRAAERAFLRVLNETPLITDVGTLDAALNEALHDSIVREKSRRAALHRFEHNEGVIASIDPHARITPASADMAWERIRRSIFVDSSRTATSADAPRHHAAIHVAGAMNRRSRWTVPAIIVGVLALCGGAYGLSRIDTGPREADIVRALAAADAQTLNAGKGQIGTVSLADESTVRLGAASQLRIGREFGTAMRAVSLDGSAAFSVATGTHPLELRAPGVALSVASGRVEVRADSLLGTLVRIRDGAAVVKTADSGWTATAGQAFMVEPGGHVRAPVALELEESLGWIDGRFGASGSLRDVVAAINRWYGADIGIGDASIIERPAEVSGSLDSLSATIRALEKSADVRRVWSRSGQMVLYSAGR